MKFKSNTNDIIRLNKKKNEKPLGSILMRLLHLYLLGVAGLAFRGGRTGGSGSGGAVRFNSMPHLSYSAISRGVSGPTFGLGKSLPYTGLSTM